VAYLSNPFITPVIHGIARFLEAQHVLPLIAETRDSHEQLKAITDQLMSRRVDAIITSAARYGDRARLEKVAGEVPLVGVVRSLQEPAFPQVIPDDTGGGAIAADHLVGLGHRRVAHLRGPTDIGNFARRTEGFGTRCRGLAVTDLTMDDAAGQPDRAEGRRLMAALGEHHSELPTAIFAPNDLMAIGALDAIHALGLSVPGDISVMGYNDMPLVENLDPPLTSIRLPSSAMGEAAGELASRMIVDDGARAPTTIELSCELQPRGSTAVYDPGS
jgi:LacI family transcriptional regulator